MTLGIVVVYIVPEGDEELLRVHLRAIGRHTVGEYRIYGAVHRAPAAARAVLAADPRVRQCALPDDNLRGSAEHSTYLARLIDTALADGVEHVAMLDVDSFPVSPGWDETMRRRLAEGNALAGMLREENTDDVRPSTPFILFPAEFYREYGPIPAHPGQPSDDPEFEAFRGMFGRPDTGDPFGYWVQRHQLPWHRLRRSNVVNDHPLLGGVYGDLIFHLGGNLRQGRWSLRDREQVFTARLRARLRDKLIAAHRRPPRVPEWLRRAIFPAEVRRARANREAYDLIRARLLADPEGYVAYLRGERPMPPDTGD